MTSKRERLPNRRGAEAIVFEHGGRRWRACLVYFTDTLRHALDDRDAGPLAAALAAITEACSG